MPSSSVFRRVIHAHALPSDLRTLLNREWSTIAVVAGLLVLLQGTASLGAVLPKNTRVDGTEPYPAVSWIFFASNVVSYMAALTSTLVAVFLQHSSNSVAQAELHAFLLGIHHILWVPLVSLLVAVVAAGISNVCAVLLIYDSWVAFGVRAGILLVWFSGLAFTLHRLSGVAMSYVVPELRDVVVRL